MVRCESGMLSYRKGESAEGVDLPNICSWDDAEYVSYCHVEWSAINDIICEQISLCDQHA